MGATRQLARGTAAALGLLGMLLTVDRGTAAAQPGHRCAPSARAQAAKLLAFHFSEADRVEIADAVKTLAPIRNPADRRQRFDVLEVWGYVEKGQYRMRFLYARLPGECVLMGQEILEYAAL